MSMRATRRGFLTAAGLAGVGLGVGAHAPSALAAGAATGGSAAEREPFYGLHQPGVATPTQEHLEFLALDVVSDTASDLAGLLSELSSAAALMMAGQPAGPLSNGDAPPVDTAEALGLPASRLTITFGLGPAIFARGRFGLEAARPGPLVDLPAFAGDTLEPGISGGDIAIQVCADDPQVAFHAAHDLMRLAQPTALPRWSLQGFGRTSNSARQSTPRNLMGFKDGTANIKVEDAQAMNRFVWTGAPESPAWMRGGSYMVVRKIKMLFVRWDALDLSDQEQVFGRHKLSGAPLGARLEHDPLDLRARRNGQLVITEDAHVRRASPAYNDGAQILRRGYSYHEGVDLQAGTVQAGLLFICFQRDPRKQFIPIQRRLAGEALSQHTQTLGSAIFACPPGASPGGFVGETLLG